uniref:Uncharacterized protein n=1 Tax=Minutocellus polymorphus TaxID=265543 RepID=A0A7S0AHW8_9STRA
MPQDAPFKIFLMVLAIFEVIAMTSPRKPMLHRYASDGLKDNNFPISLAAKRIPRGGAAAFGFPSGWHPFGYTISELGQRYLAFDGSRDGDVGRFLSSTTSGRKSRKTRNELKDHWREITRYSKKRQSMRIYRTLDDLIDFCLDAGFIE